MSKIRALWYLMWPRSWDMEGFKGQRFISKINVGV